MEDWVVQNWLPLAGLIVAVAAIPSGFLAARRWGSRRGKLVFTATATPILAIKDIATPQGLNGKVEVSIGGIALDNPHIVRLRLENIGPHDISSNHFDAGKPLSICLGKSEFTANMRTDLDGEREKKHSFRMQVSVSVGAGESNRKALSWVDVHPHLIKRRGFWEAEILMSGEPELALTNSLIDADIVENHDWKS